MKNFLTSSLLVVAGLSGVIQVEENHEIDNRKSANLLQADNIAPWSHPERRSGLSDLLAALEGGGGGAGKEIEKTTTVTVTKAEAAEASPVEAKNATCTAEKTVTVEKTIEKTIEKTVTAAGTGGGGGEK
jgi:hypothetical protein